jgi:DNA-directed RNA polymerase specialized sigma24 family protein
MAWSRLLPSLRHVVAYMSQDLDEQDDYLQEALVHLWTLDVTRFDLRQHAERSYLRRILVNHMWSLQRAAQAPRLR